MQLSHGVGGTGRRADPRPQGAREGATIERGRPSALIDTGATPFTDMVDEHRSDDLARSYLSGLTLAVGRRHTRLASVREALPAVPFRGKDNRRST
jgi:hypothetical protein